LCSKEKVFNQKARFNNIESTGFVKFISAPNDMRNEIHELKIEALMAFDWRVPDHCGGIMFKPQFYLKVVDEAVAAFHFYCSGIWNEIHNCAMCYHR